MSYKVFNKEWAESFCEKLNLNDEYRIAASEWEWPIILKLEDENKGVYLDLYKGNCNNVRPAGEPDFENAEFVITASKETWEKILTGKTDPVTAIMIKKLKLEKGSMAELVKNVNAAKELVNSAKQVETEF